MKNWREKFVTMAVSATIVGILSVPLATVLSPRIEKPCLDWATFPDGRTECAQDGPTSLSIGLSPTDYMKRVSFAFPGGF